MNQGLQYELESVMPAAILTGLFTSLCTIQQPSGNVGPSGAPDGTFSDVAGLVAIPCMDAPPSMARVQATEMKAVAEIMAQGLRHVLLAGFYPILTQGDVTGTGKGWRAVVDGVHYDMLGAEFDSQNTQTRLDLRLVNV